MILTNQIIYTKYIDLQKWFNTACEIKMPVKINFFLQKNLKMLQEAAQEIEDMRISLIEKYGAINNEGSAYDIPAEHVKEVNIELNNLFMIEQDIPLHIFKLEDFGNIELSYSQMETIMFMIVEN